ncbi:2-hydroxy-acid oxidase, partial [Klebsiella pneumoniae]|uniref:FAD-binding oxidoreductase n=1 Tax=Klebsiella pneumoniae TaxID=573 RepID=UPI000FF21DA7
MKNVTGLDLVKLLAGSYGTLGFLTEVTFRVLPVPPAQTTLVISGLEDEAATHAIAAAIATSVAVNGAALLPASFKSRFLSGSLPDGAATVLRLEGLGASVEARSQKLQTILSRLGHSVFLGEDDSKKLWREIRDVTPYAANLEKPLWRVSVAPSQG